MSGKQLNVFSISVTSMSILNPLKVNDADFLAFDFAFALCRTCSASTQLSLTQFRQLYYALDIVIQSIISTNNAFKTYEDQDGKVDLQVPKLIWIALNMAWLLIGVYKMSSMRLLPTTSADWAGAVLWKEMLEESSVPSSWT